MASASASGDWLLIEELLERGDPAFVEALRAIHDADALARFAERWSNDRRPASRRLLLEYLDRPLNAFRHEALVKRLFKRAEAAGDDELLARFLVAFDRSIRRVRRKRRRWESRETSGRDAAQALAAAWRDQGFDYVNVWEWRGAHHVHGAWSEEAIATPRNTTMPRGKLVEIGDYSGFTYRRIKIPDWVVALRLPPNAFRKADAIDVPAEHRGKLARFRLFSVATREYLRRRAWRYFRRLGAKHPERYGAAISNALRHYDDADMADGLALIDNWGLMHALFHHSPALAAKPVGWSLAEGHTLAELQPAPYYAKLWQAAPRAAVDLLLQARSRPVRQWAMAWIKDNPEARAALTLEELLGLLGRDDAEIVAFASESLRSAEGLDAIGPERWLALAETTNPAALDVISELMARHLPPEHLTFAQLVRLAMSRPLPLARLGLNWLRSRAPRDATERAALLGLAEAEAEPVRPELVRWARGLLSASPDFQVDWVLEYLDSRHADVRAEGLAWFRDEPRARDDVALWRKLLESPYDDVRLALVADLESRLAQRDFDADAALDAENLLRLWAAVLLNIHRGNRAKPLVVRQLMRRVERHPDDLPRLLPILGVALRSVRGPEWRAGLAAVVRLVERRPETAPTVRSAFPELQWS
jgi:hypothetical protein